MVKIVGMFMAVLICLFGVGCGSEINTQSDNFKPQYSIISEKDVSTGYAVRKTIQISLPDGLDKKTVEDNITYAAKDAEKKYAKSDKGLAIDIYAFSDNDVKRMNAGDYVKCFAEGTYAHNGEWTNSDQKYSPSMMKAKITINNEDYFKK